MSEDIFGDLPDTGTFRAPTHEEVPHRILATEVRVHTVAKALREVRGVLGRIFWMAAAGVVATVVSSLVSGIWIGGWRERTENHERRLDTLEASAWHHTKTEE